MSLEPNKVRNVISRIFSDEELYGEILKRAKGEGKSVSKFCNDVLDKFVSDPDVKTIYQE